MAKKNTNVKGGNDENLPENTIVSMNYGGHQIDVALYSKFDMTGFDKDTIIDWYKFAHLGRRLDDKAALYLKMAKGWSYHAPFSGHDGIQLAIGKSFKPGVDFLFPYYRDLLTALTAGITVEEIILNGLSKDTDVAGGGRHMSNHFAKPSIRIQNVSSCTGNHSLHAVGVARAIKRYKGDEVAIYSGGESACSEGYFYEGLNWASLEKLPVVFVIQNNKYGISVPHTDQTANIIVSENYKGLKDLAIFNCDGRDYFDSYRAMQSAIQYSKAGNGPSMVHADCDRVGSHSNSDRHELYRPEEERMTVKLRDPLMQFRWHLLNKGILTESELYEIEEHNKELIFRAADVAESAPNANGKSWDQFILPPAFYDGKEVSFKTDDTHHSISMIEAINRTLKEEFRSNPNTFLWGQDIGKGGVFNVVKGMPEEFGKERVFNAPIAEDSIVGTANGFSRYSDKIRVVVEGAEFADYFWPAMEQLIECSHDYWRTKGQFSPNVVIRLASGGYIQGGLYHSQNLESILTTIPGIRVVIPSYADDAIGLLRNCIRSQGTTLFLEPKFLYNYKNASSHIPTDDYIIPFGKAKIRREGSDISIITYGTTVHFSMLAAEHFAKEGINCEVIDLRSLAPWDEETVISSVKKTGRALVVHEDRVFSGFGGEIASVISSKAFKYLDAPVERLGSKNVPVGFAKEYEQEILVNKLDIINSIKKVLSF